MEIINKKISKLVPYIHNAKKHPAEQVDKIARSIQEFGFLVPVLIDGHGEIIAGHGRVLAAQQLKIKEVPTICADHLTPAQVKAFRIADNRLAESEWVYDVLEQELTKLKECGFDIDLTGFSGDDYVQIVNDLQKKQGLTDEDEIPQDIKPITASGDLYIMGVHKLLCASSTDNKNIKKLFNSAIPTLVYSDPPYGIMLLGGARIMPTVN